MPPTGSRPTSMWRRRLRREYLTSLRIIGRVLHTTPFAHDHEQRAAIVPAQHAGEAAAVEADSLKHLAALTHAHATLVRDVGVPHGACGVDADTVRHAVAELRPGAPVRQSAVACDVKSCELFSV